MDGAGYRMYGAEGRARVRLKADAAPLRKWLDRRRESLRAVRSPFESLWKEIRLQFEPNLGKALLDQTDRDAAAAGREDGSILNSEPRQAVGRYAAGMQSGITNKAQAWCAIVPKGLDESLRRDIGVSRWCSTATREVLAAFERHNLYRSTLQVYAHAALFGTSLTMVFRGDGPGEMHFRVVDEGDYWLSEDGNGCVETVMRRVSMTLAQAADEFYEAALPEHWRRMLSAGEDETRVECWNLICPNRPGDANFADIPRERPYASFWWCADAGSAGADGCGMLAARSFSYRPFAVMRQNTAGSVWGKGIGEESLGDAKELQKLEEYSLRLVANEATPAMLASSELKGRAINSFPGGVTYYNQMGAQAPVSRLFETREGLDKVEAKIQTVAQRISRAWYNDLFSLMLSINQGHRTQKTATEVSELAGEKVTLLGPVLTQMDEYLTDLVDAVFAILLSDGIIPPPPQELAAGGGDVSVEYTSSIHAEMRAALKMRSINALVQMTAMLAQAKPEALDKLKVDEIIDEVCAIYPGAAEYVRSAKEVEDYRAKAREAAREAEVRAELKEVSRNAGQQAKALSETKVGNGNALEALMGGGV